MGIEISKINLTLIMNIIYIYICKYLLLGEREALFLYEKATEYKRVNDGMQIAKEC